MIRAGAGLARGGDMRSMADQATRAALAQAGLERADTLLVFAAGEDPHQARDLVDTAREAAGGAAVIGCGGAGVLAAGHESEAEPAVAVLALAAPPEQLTLTPLFVPGLEDDPEAVGHRLGVTARAAQATAVMLLPDAFTLRAPPLLAGIAAGLREPRPIVGAAAASSLGPASNQWAAGEVASNAVAGAALAGSAGVHVAMAQGCRPISPWKTVTRARGTVLLELDGEPAFEVFSKLVPGPLASDLGRASRSVLVGLPPVPGSDHLVVRGIAGFEPDKGWIGLGQSIESGSKLRFVLREAHAARSQLTAALDDLAARLAGRRPAFGVYFDCAGRGEGLFGVPDHDTAYIHRALGEFPLVGLFGGGEIGPRGPGDGAPALHLFSGVLLIVTQPVATA